MPVEVIMPKVDMDMATGKLSVWHVSEGEAVAKGAPLFDIETDKAAMEVESPASGRLHHVIAGPGQTVDVGKPVAWIYAEGEDVGARPGGAPAPAAEALPGRHHRGQRRLRGSSRGRRVSCWAKCRGAGPPAGCSARMWRASPRQPRRPSPSCPRR